jgi:hypothetical protein
MAEIEFQSRIKVPAATTDDHAVNRGQMNTAIAAVGGGAAASYLGAQMEPPQGYYPDFDIVTNVLQAAAPTDYTSQVIHTHADSPARFRVGGTLVEMEGFLWNNINGNEITGDNHVAGMTSYEIEFWCSGTDLTIELRNEPGTTGYGNSDYLIVVDDMIMAPSNGGSNVADVANGWNHTPGTTAVRYHVLQFSTARVRRIRLMLGNIALAGVRIPGASDIWPAPPRLRCAITGDSWCHAALNSTEGDIIAGTIPGELALATGWEVWNLSQGGTGYENPGAGATSEFWSADRQAALAAIPAMDCIIVLGGGNDSSEGEEMGPLADIMWSGIKTARPSSTLIVVGAQSPALFAGLEDLNDHLREHALANEDVDLFVDMWEPAQWITGTSGHIEDRDGNGSRDMFITNESLADIHPTHAGARNVAERLARAMRGAA